jgi:hypothetical protein
MKTEIILNPNSDTITILEGKALEQKYPVQININGNIHSVAQFIKERYGEKTGGGLQQIDKTRAIVLVDEQEMLISLCLDPENVFGTKINGFLKTTAEFEQFHINEAMTFSREELVKLFRFNRRFFGSDHDKLLTAYQKLNISTAGKLEQENDTRGNKGINFQKTVDSSSIPTGFNLTVPIYKGFDPVSFPVEICLDATDASVRFWFESPILVEVVENMKKSIFEEQLEYCKDFVIIHK